ncbi:MAG: protein translocase subunit SecF [Corynebacterium casei]|uniref:Protein translocase subunit SecF n=1 Tax=Corynebacterium casei LMG S-19264 TaxID=1285583 RepID=A0ABN4CE59_9CORY|nr:protein translocase subunit SecF [Corynebacterium casei]AHI19928.1 preprotein translocase subunit SecF [Corynebacterium casei LMG S-19264]MDN5800206.1 protein translocase subunit SecF [Corynebacterium casei]MDN5826811.1 protein translocase subunit SecF [Corynebacterium casei]MDN5840209.1 protein translocase subunit SecF [Corynebacterium casei]MDN5883097.1 protein translocase subunit SecF [Corynebacterium casei]
MAANKSKISRMDRLYLDEGGFDFIGRAKTWYAITAGLLIVAIAAIAIRGFTLSLDFEGGTKVSLPAANLEEQAVGEVFEEATGIEPEQVQIVGSGNSATLEVNSERLTEEQADAARLAIYEEFEPVNAMGESTPDAVGVSTVSESWGSTITQRMVIAMIVFLVIATAYVAFRLQRTMAIAAILALIADGVIIAGLYALFGLEVSPAVIIGLLTVLTFSIYDSVIVFDKVNENTEGITGQRNRTYAEQTNLAINQTVMRSISTSVISALPIVALFIVAVWMMGIGTLRDLALIQLIGVIEGIFSSIFLASPLVVSLANRSKKIQQHNKDVAEYRASAEFTEEQEAGAGSESDHGTKRQVVSPTKQVTNLEGTQANRTGSSWRPGR